MSHPTVCRIAQLNTHRSDAPSAVAAREFSKQDLSVMLIQEPWANNRRILGLSTRDSFTVYDVRQERPRACVMVRKSLTYTVLSEFLSRDLVAIECSNISPAFPRGVVIASAYFPGDQPPVEAKTPVRQQCGQPKRAAELIPSKEVQLLVEHCKRNHKPLLIGCDANAHHTEWGSTDINKRGESLLEFIIKENLEIFNVGNEPTFVTKARKEVLDITFGSPELGAAVTEWRVSSIPSQSDHRLITFGLAGNIPGTSDKRNPRNTDWERYKVTLKCNLDLKGPKSVPKSAAELEEACKMINEAIIFSYEDSCPVKKTKQKNDAPWWNARLEKRRKTVRKLFNRAKNTGEWQVYQEESRAYNRDLRQAKFLHYRKFCEEIKETPEAARVHKLLKKEPSAGNMALRTPQGDFTSSEEERARLLLLTHFPGSEETCQTPCAPLAAKPSRDDWKNAIEIGTEEQIKWAINSFKPFKSPGPDQIIPALLQAGLDALMPYLIRIFRSSIATGYIPSTWRRARVVFIPKVGGKDPTQAKSYRPISLTSFLLKTQEKLIDKWLRSTTLNLHPLHAYQHAFRAGRSTDTALYQLTEKIQNSLDHKEISLCAFLDIEGAFDNTSHTAIRRALERRMVKPTLIRWITNMLRTRVAETEIGNSSIAVLTTRGCPQGGVLSPLLWCLVVDELLDKLTSEGITVQGYADDIVIIARGKWEEVLCDLVQKGLNITQRWCKSVGLNINPTKTSLITFTRRTSLKKMKTIYLDGVEVKQDKQIKYLGVLMDSKLRWHLQEEAAVDKARKAIMVCRRMANKSWGCSPRIMLWMYKMMVLPIVTYGAIAWASRTKLATTKKSLDKLQRLACICITGAMRTCPTAGMEALLDLPPLHRVILNKANETKLRMYALGADRETSLTGKDRAALLRTLPICKLPLDSIEKTSNRGNPIKVHLGSKATFKTEKDLKIKPGTVLWYTDGSLTSEGTGAGVYGPYTKLSLPMGKIPSIFQAEVYAIDKCAEVILKRGYKSKDIAIMSDSQAAIKAIGASEINSKLVLECVKKLKRLSENNRVNIYWVPGHIGIKGNEMADQLAKSGAATPLTGDAPCGLSLDKIKEHARRKDRDKMMKEWRNLPALRQSKEMIGNYNSSRSQCLLNLSRNNVRIITGFLTGHCKLGGHLAKMKLVDNGECRFCGDSEETPLHLLQDCRAKDRLRWNTLRSVKPKGSTLLSLSPTKIIRFLRELGLAEEL